MHANWGNKWKPLQGYPKVGQKWWKLLPDDFWIQIDPGCTSLMKSHPLDQGLFSFKDSKLASCFRERETSIPFGSLLLSYFGVFVCQENPSFYSFSKLFSTDFLDEKKSWFFLFIHLSILKLLGLGKTRFSSCVDSRRSRDQACYGFQVCLGIRRWEAESERC